MIKLQKKNQSLQLKVEKLRRMWNPLKKTPTMKRKNLEFKPEKPHLIKLERNQNKSKSPWTKKRTMKMDNLKLKLQVFHSMPMMKMLEASSMRTVGM